MNISKVAQLAANAIKAVKSMPTAGKVALGALFGGGLLTGVLLTPSDKFEKEKVENLEQQIIELQKQIAKQDSLTQVQTKAEEKKEPEFKYVPPEVGKNGIAKADTTYYAGTDVIAEIRYVGEDGKFRHSTEFDKEGKLESFTDGTREEWYKYDKNGKESACRYETADGNYYQREDKPDGGYNIVITDKKGNPIEERACYKSGDDLKHYEIKYNADGSKTVSFSDDKEKRTYDKNDRLLNTKVYKWEAGSEVLQYTVVPRYNKDGDVIKNDTIRTRQ